MTSNAEHYDEDEDLFDFASLEGATAALEADELDVEEFLAAAEHLEDKNPRDESAQEQAEEPVSGAASESVEQPSPAQELTPAPRPRSEKRARSASNNAPAVTAHVVAGLHPAVLAIGALMLIMNAGLAFFAWERSAQAADRLEKARGELRSAANDLVVDLDQSALDAERARRPIAAPTELAIDTLAHVQQSVDRGDFELARRQIYAILSTIDRVAPSRRDDLEARASFMLGDIDEHQARMLRQERGQ